MHCPHCNSPNPDEARFCAACGKATSATEPVSPSHPGLHLAAPNMIGREIAGRYRIQAKLGEGGMGAVFKAEQISLKRTCAVKLLRPDVAGTAIMLRRFNAEAEAVAKLSHPNTVNIYDFGQDTDGSFFIAMEFIEGKSLREAIHTEAPFPLRRALSIAVQVSASLVDAHSQSIIHRDLKPDNVMLQSRGRSRDVARVLDFGIAKLRDEGRATQAAMTQAGDMLGTPQYMAPEQIRAEQIDGRTDVYALGCMMYEMVTARLPFEAPTVMALLSKHLLENPPSPSQRRPDLAIPPVIDELIMQAIAKDPNARPPTMEAFGERITAVLATLPADPNASAQQSAVVGVPMVPSTLAPNAPSHAPGAPGAQSAGYPPQATPMPGGYPYPTPPPPHTPPPGFSHGQYATPMQAAMQPHAPSPMQGQPPMHAQLAPRSSGSSKTLLMILGGLAVVGIVAGIVVATRSNSDSTVAVVTSDAGSADPVVTPTTPTNPTKGSDDDSPPDDPPVPDKPDVWAGGSSTTSIAAAALAKMQGFKSQMCACKTKSCVDRVNTAMTAWSGELEKAGGSLDDLDPAMKAKITDVAQAYGVCMGTALAAENTPKAPSTADLMRAVERLADRACACSDANCARKVVGELVALAARFKDAQDGDETRMDAAGRRLGQCAVTAGMDAQELMTALQQLSN